MIRLIFKVQVLKHKIHNATKALKVTETERYKVLNVMINWHYLPYSISLFDEHYGG